MDLESRTRHPVFIHYETDGGPYGAPNLLSLLPVQGIALRPGKTYAAVVRRSLLSAKGRPVTAPNSWPTFDRCSPVTSNSSVGNGPAPTRVVYALMTAMTRSIACGGSPEPVEAPPAVAFELVTMTG